MHALGSHFDTSSLLRHKSAEDVLTIGTSRLNKLIPIIGPPEINFSGCIENPPASSISSLIFIPIRTLKFDGLFIASPVTVTILLTNGFPNNTACCTATAVSALFTTHPASAGNIEELIALFVTA